ncbi:sensor histidine kinase [Actinomycetes bacterium KLBMP 9759]
MASLVERQTRGRTAVALDVALGVTVAVVVSLAIYVNLGGERGPDLTAYMFAVGLGALMLVRRSYPLLTLLASAIGILAYYAAGYPMIGLAVPVAFALYSAAEAGKTRWAVLTIVGLVVISSLARLQEGDDPRYVFGYELATSLSAMAAAVALGSAARARRLWRSEQRQRERQLLHERELETSRRVEEERLRIAREVHDVLAHTVSVITLHAGVAAEAVEDDPEGAKVALGHVRTASEQAMREIRSTVGLLRDPDDPDRSAPVGGLDQLDRVVASATAGGLPVTLRVEGEREPLPAAVDSTAYRIVQEALTNTIRHAGATAAEVCVRYGGARLAIRVTDDGQGGAGGTGGHGISGMRERAALLGGTVIAGAMPGGGFEVSATLPVEPS